MNRDKKEQGYALVIVLFSVIFIMTLAAVFMRGSISNAKQEIQVDESNLTVTTAEAGVDYYTFLFNKRFEDAKPDLIKFTNEKIDEAKKKNKEPDFIHIQELVALKVKDLFLEESSHVLSKKIPIFDYEHELTFIDISLQNVDEDRNLPISIEGTVDGLLGERRIKTLTFQQVFFIPRLDIKTDSDLKIGHVIDVPTWIDKYKPSKPCSNRKKLANETCYADHKNDISELEDVENSKVYVDKHFHSEEDLDVDEKSVMFVRNDLKIREELELEGKSKLFVGKDLFIQNQNSKDDDDDDGELDIDEHSYLFVQRDAHIKGELELEGNSFMYVGRDMKLEDELEVEEESSLYVGGELSASGKFEVKGKSKVCASELKIKKANLDIGDGSYIYYLNKTDTTNHRYIKKVDSLAELKNKCGMEDYGDTSTEIEFNIDPVIKNVIYN